MNIYQALEKDHKEVKSVLSHLVDLKDDQSEKKKELIQKVRDLLVPHSRVEEAVFYNLIRARSPEKAEVLHGYKEHMEAEALLRALQAEGLIGLPWKTTATQLKEALEHHIEEEESKVFALAKQVVKDEEAQSLAKVFETLKPEVKKEGFMKNSLDLMINLVPPNLMSDIKNAFKGS